jgi:hypothetical protein
MTPSLNRAEETGRTGGAELREVALEGVLALGNATEIAGS